MQLRRTPPLIGDSFTHILILKMLPTATEVKNGDLLILQTQTYTKSIDFNNLNFLKTDTSGNAVVLSDLSGNNSFFNTLSVLDNFACNTFTTSGVSGVNLPTESYNQFIINGGLVTRAVSSLGSPEYATLTGTVIRNITAYQNNFYKRIADESSTSPWILPANQYILILQNTRTRTYVLSGFFTRNPWISLGELKPWHFYLTPTLAVSSIPYVDIIGTDHHNNLTFQADAGYSLDTSTNFSWRIFFSKKI